MPNSISSDVSVLRGHEPQNIVDNGGSFALGENLKPTVISLKAIKIALPRDFGQTHIAAAALLSVVTKKKVDFIFVTGESDPGYCTADFCMVPVSPLWGRNEDVLATMLAIVRYTPWFAEKFSDPGALNLFVRAVYDKPMDVLFDMLDLGELDHEPLEKRAFQALLYAKQVIGTLHDLWRARDKQMSLIRAAVNDNDVDVLIVPDYAARGPAYRMLQGIAVAEKDCGEAKKHPFYAVIAREGKSWCVYPAHKLEDDGSFSVVPHDAMKLAKVLKGVGCTSHLDTYVHHVLCPDRRRALCVAVWLMERNQGKNTRLEDILKINS